MYEFSAQHITLIVSLAVFFVARLYPTWHRRFRGCDAYNILLCTEILRKSKTLPIVVPDLFILEDNEQWYPPGFMVLCALLPEQWLKRNYWYVNHIVDFSHAALLALTSLYFNSPLLGAALVTAYAILPTLTYEYSTLTTRPLGVLLFTLFMLCAYWSQQYMGLLPLAVLFGALLFYSHKLSIQQLWFTLPILTIVTADLRWIGFLVAIYLAAFVLWPKGFVEILKGHRNIVLFWSRFWPQLGTHMVHSSPIYGNQDYNNGHYSVGYLAGLKRLLINIIHQNYFGPVVFLVSMTQSFPSPLDLFLVTWIGSVYMFALLIYLVPALRGIGFAEAYIKYAHIPVFLHIAAFGKTYPIWGSVLLVGAIAFELRQYILVSRNVRSTQSDHDDPENRNLDKLFDDLPPNTRLLCLPAQIGDYIAYRHRVAVYRGTHNQCFDDRLAAFFPVMQRRIEEYAEDGDLTHMLLDTSYIDPKTFMLDKQQAKLSCGKYLIFDLGNLQRPV